MSILISCRQLVACLVAFQFLSVALALNCYQCGQYNEGVGSITPCLNATAQLRLSKCNDHHAQYCIKYVTELSTVRDCATTCVEKESWGSRTYCCSTDECNSAVMQRPRDVIEYIIAAVMAQATLLCAIFY